MSRLFLGMSHTPLLGLNPIAPEVEQPLLAAIAEARRIVRAFDPELIVLAGPDHYNGFFNELMPPFCLGTEAQSVGDYQTPAGPLNVDAATSLALAEALMDADFDIAVSRRMQVDHGFAQVLQLIWDGLDTPPVVPLFVNAVAQPAIARLRRCRALGVALGDALTTLEQARAAQGLPPRRTLLIGSGGLSHEPPVPTLAHPDPAIRERITVKRESTPDERAAKTQRVMAAGMALARGDAGMKPLAPSWDQRWMDALAGDSASLDALCAQTEASITEQAGLSAHESKCWLIARTALGDAASGHLQPAPSSLFRHYQAIPAYIAGFGIQILQAHDTTNFAAT